jgi:hypothetical protein
MKRALVLCAVLPIAIVLVRMQLEGRALLDEAARLSDRADLDALERRVLLLGRAARRLGGPAGRARLELAQLGRRQVPGAWLELRSAILATRWLWTPDPALLDEANAALAEQRALEHLAAGRIGGTPPPPDELARERTAQRARLEATGEPSRLASLLTLAGLIAFIIAAARALLHGRSRNRLLVGGAGLVAFLLGLWRA